MSGFFFFFMLGTINVSAEQFFVWEAALCMIGYATVSLAFTH